MWILERYFDISRKSEPTPRKGVLGLVLFTLAAFLTSCVVTDKIEFEEAVNQPFAIISRDPIDNIIQWDAGTSLTFSVTVWDPDFEEVQDVTLAGKLVARSDLWSRPITRRVYCPPESLAPSEDGKVTFLVACEEDLQPANTSGTLVEFTLVVSDLGFYANGEPRFNANVIEQTWVVRMP